MYCGESVASNGKLTNEQKNFFQLICLDFYIELTTQIYKSFSFNDKFLQLCNQINPDVVKSRKEKLVNWQIVFKHLTNQKYYKKLTTNGVK